MIKEFLLLLLPSSLTAAKVPRFVEGRSNCKLANWSKRGERERRNGGWVG